MAEENAVPVEDKLIEQIEIKKKKVYYKILLVGATGGGKTYSFEKMNPETTGFINIENKPLPFKNNFKFFKNTTTIKEFGEVLNEFNSNKNIDCLVIDSFSAYIELALQELRAIGISGYDLWSQYNSRIGMFCSDMKAIRKHVFTVAHYEILDIDGEGTKEKRVKCKGKEWEGMLEKEFTIVMYTKVNKTKGKLPEHLFRIINDGDDSTKVPPGIFEKDKFTIPNDSNFVLQKIKEFLK